MTTKPQIIMTPPRRHLPVTRQSLTHKFSVGGHEGYITVGLFENGDPGELFITMAKEGSTIGGLMDVIGTQTSMCLQYHVPLDVLVNKFSHSRFEPAGWTNNPDIPNAKSVVDYIFRWMGMEFIPGYREANAPKRVYDEVEADEETTSEAAPATASTATATTPAPVPAATVQIRTTAGGSGGSATNGHGNGQYSVHDAPGTRNQQFAKFQSDAPACDNCGAITVRNGNCYLCHNCGNSMGCS